MAEHTNAGKHTKLVLLGAWKRTTDSVLREFLVALLPAGIVTVLLYLRIIGRELAVNELQSWLILIAGIVMWAGFAFIWNVVQTVHAVWQGDQESLLRQEHQITEMTKKMQPAFSVFCDESYRVTTDQKLCWLVFRIHNNGVEAAHGCFVKIVSFICSFSASPVGVRPAPGARFAWNHTSDSTCMIAGRSQEYVNIGFRHSDLPDTWALATKSGAETFPLPSGIFELTIEACGDNVVSDTSSWRVSYKPDGLFHVVRLP